MARSILEIYDALIEQKQTLTELNSLQPNIDSSQQLLNDLNSTSKVAIWRLIFFVIAVGIWMVENIFDEHKSYINSRVDELIVGSDKWIELKAREFQFGDPLVWLGNRYGYETINEANRIVKLVAVTPSAGMVLVKVAKLVGEDPTPLTNDELAAFSAYMAKIKFAGILMPCVSRNADEIRLHYRVYIDPLVLNIDGSLKSNPSVKPVEDAINNYCKNLPFNGIYTVTEQTDLIQGAEGVFNPVFVQGFTRFGTTVWQPLGDYYTPNAGYLKVSDDFPLSVTIDYVV